MPCLHHASWQASWSFCHRLPQRTTGNILVASSTFCLIRKLLLGCLPLRLFPMIQMDRGPRDGQIGAPIAEGRGSLGVPVQLILPERPDRSTRSTALVVNRSSHSHVKPSWNERNQSNHLLTIGNSLKYRDNFAQNFRHP